MFLRKLFTVLLVISSTAICPSSRATEIDSFDVPQAQVSVTGFNLAGSAVSHPDILSGQRDMGIVGGAKSVGVATAEVLGGAVQFDGSSQTGANTNQPAVFVLEYDGLSDQGSAFGGALIGSGGVDLTNEGTATALILCFQFLDYNVAAGGSNFDVALRDVDDRMANLAIWNEDIRSAAPFTLVLPFAGTTPGSSIGSGFRFDAVGSVRIQFRAHEMRFRLSSFSTGTASRNACSTIGPCHELDANNDGRLDLEDYGALAACFNGLATCGNGVKELAEECDGGDDSACPGACMSDCTCGAWACGEEEAGDCCDPAGNGTARCADEICCSAVCELDPYCCEVEWDAFCARQAVLSFANDCACESPVCGNDITEPGEECDGLDDLACSGLCGPDCFCTSICGNPAAGDCCEPSPEPDGVGCSNATCCEAVCAFEPMCCEQAWDPICADLASFKFPVECQCP